MDFEVQRIDGQTEIKKSHFRAKLRQHDAETHRQAGG
jgi:hypothetical protein